MNITMEKMFSGLVYGGNYGTNSISEEEPGKNFSTRADRHLYPYCRTWFMAVYIGSGTFGDCLINMGHNGMIGVKNKSERCGIPKGIR